MHFSGEKKVPNQIPNFTNMHVYLRVTPTLVILRIKMQLGPLSLMGTPHLLSEVVSALPSPELEVLTRQRPPLWSTGDNSSGVSSDKEPTA